MTNFTVGPTPLNVIGQAVDRGPTTIQNTGSVSIYISADPGVSTKAFEYKIDAGGDFIWPTNKMLSVCTGPGVIGQISFGGSGDVKVNSGSTNVTGNVTINGTVPISGPVTISGTVPITGNVGFTGPVSVSGGVSVTGSQVNIGTVNNAVALLNTYNTVLPASTTTVIGNLNAAQLLIYQTLIVTAPAVGLGANAAVSSLYIQWKDSSGNIIGTDSPVMYSNGALEYAIPIRGTTATVSVTTSAIGSHNALPIQIYGSVYLLPRRYYSAPATVGALSGLTLNALSDSSGAGMWGIDASPATASTVNVFLPGNSGRCSAFIDTPNASGTTMILGTLGRSGNFDASTRLFYLATTAVTIINGQPLIMPEAPLMLSIGSATTARVMLNLSWDMK